MNQETEKCILVIEESLPVGMIANTAAILGMTLGKRLPELVGSDIYDMDRMQHAGITEVPLPVLKASKETMKMLRNKLYDVVFEDLFVVDFSDIAQRCNAYEDYIRKMAHSPKDSLAYLGIAICGNKKKVNKLTSSLPLLR